jgi:hypothetical protein
MPEIGTLRSTSGERKRSDAEWPQPPRLALEPIARAGAPLGMRGLRWSATLVRTGVRSEASALRFFGKAAGYQIVAEYYAFCSAGKDDTSFRGHGLHNWAFCGGSKMPWQECNLMDERLKFIARVLDGRRWRGCAARSACRGRPATRSSPSIRRPATRPATFIHRSFCRATIILSIRPQTELRAAARPR